MDNSLGGRIAIVTGSDSGIGQGTAIALGEAGADVVVTYLHDADGANDTRAAVEGVGRRVRVVPADVGDEASVMAMFAAAVDAFGRVDDSIRTNLYGPLLCCQHFLRHHRTTGGGRAGRIINITSVHEEIPRAGAADYDCAKGALRNLTRTLALETADAAITVNNIGLMQNQGQGA